MMMLLLLLVHVSDARTCAPSTRNVCARARLLLITRVRACMRAHAYHYVGVLLRLCRLGQRKRICRRSVCAVCFRKDDN